MYKETDVTIHVHPLTTDRWDDLVTLFGERGAVGGCWCMWWREGGQAFKANAGEPNKMAFKALVDEGDVPGLIAYRDGRPIGWCSIAPRVSFARFPQTRYWRDVDNQPVWSVVCFFVAVDQRGQAVATALLDAAIQYAASYGAQIIEAYPKEVGENETNTFIYTGTLAMFQRAGFVEVARRHPSFPIMRLMLN